MKLEDEFLWALWGNIAVERTNPGAPPSLLLESGAELQPLPHITMAPATHARLALAHLLRKRKSNAHRAGSYPS